MQEILDQLSKQESHYNALATKAYDAFLASLMNDEDVYRTYQVNRELADGCGMAWNTLSSAVAYADELAKQ